MNSTTIQHPRATIDEPDSDQRSKKAGTYVRQTLVHLGLIAGACLMALPFVWMVLSSFKDTVEAITAPAAWLPNRFKWENYTTALTAMPFGRAYLNSFYIAFLVVAGQLFTCSLAGYSFAKIQFPFRDTLFVLFLMTLVIPFHVTIIPIFLMMKQLGWLDSHLSLIVPSALFDAFGVFFLRQFIRGLPRELDDAAVMDGANPWIAYRRIIVPLIKPALSALAIFSFLGQWNNFFMPLIFLNSAEKATVPLLIASFQGQWTTDWPVMLASVSIAVVPVLVVFVIAQRYIVEGAALSGIAH